MPINSGKFNLTGFVIKRSDNVLELNTGSMIFSLDSTAVVLKNPLISKHLDGKAQITLSVEPSDIKGARPSDHATKEGVK